MTTTTMSAVQGDAAPTQEPHPWTALDEAARARSVSRGDDPPTTPRPRPATSLALGVGSGSVSRGDDPPTTPRSRPATSLALGVGSGQTAARLRAMRRARRDAQVRAARVRRALLAPTA